MDSKDAETQTPSYSLPDLQPLLAEALQLSRYVLGQVEVDEEVLERRRTRLRQIQQILKEVAHPIQRDRLPPHAIPLHVRQAFVTAVLLVTRYRQLGGSTWRGTLPSPTLNQYAPDPVPAEWLHEGAIAHLCQVFDLPENEHASLARLLHTVDGQILLQRRMIQAVLTDYGLETDGTTPDSITRLTLFQQLFGELPIPVEAIDWVYTEMQLYCCLNYRDGQFYQRQPDGTHVRLDRTWDATDHAQLQQFLSSLGQFDFEQFRRFPIFGACNPTTLNPDWCDRLAQTLGWQQSDLIQSLTRSVSIIPTQKAEAFLVHDIWGHHWQLMLTQFKGDYAILATYDVPLRAAETAYTLEGPLTCRELFVVEGDRIRVDEGRSRLFFHGEVHQRLGLLFTHMMGELLADVAEFKFIWDHGAAADQLLSSSLFKTEPTKLDLTLTDLDFLFLRVLKPLLDLKLSVLDESPLELDLLADWSEVGHPVHSLAFRMSLKEAIAQLYQLFLKEYNAAYLPTLTENTSIFTHIVGNLLYIQNVISSLYTDLAGIDHPALPFQDLLLVFISRYFSSDSYTEFWDVDDVLAAYFLPCWHVIVHGR